MNSIIIKINLDNGAFSGEGCGDEIVSMLKMCEDKYRGMSFDELQTRRITLRDINGNICGHIQESADKQSEED